MAKQKVIVDGDWGGDEMQIMALLKGQQDKVDVIGATVTFGNVELDQTVENAGRTLKYTGFDDLEYYPGARRPIVKDLPPGDGAHGADGIGGVVLPKADKAPAQRDAQDYLIETLSKADPGSITVIATGPLTNIAHALAGGPDVARGIKEILVMGGATAPIPTPDGGTRQGNITPHAEFNFFMDPHAAQDVFDSGVPVKLYPMNLTHQLTATEERLERLHQALPGERGQQAAGMLTAPAALDAAKFGSAPVMHDVHTAIGLVAPELYEGRRGRVDMVLHGEQVGLSLFTPDPSGSVVVQETLRAPDRAFDMVVEGLKAGTPAPQPTPSLTTESAPKAGPRPR